MRAGVEVLEDLFGHVAVLVVVGVVVAHTVRFTDWL